MPKIGTLKTCGLFESGSYWRLLDVANGYSSSKGYSLATQVAIGRRIQVLLSSDSDIAIASKRIKVRLLEDGYTCWIDIFSLLGKVTISKPWKPIWLSFDEINERLEQVLQWVGDSSKKQNSYLWGGTLGPDFDCSGLVQAAFASQEIWLPRDAYQQEEFCHLVNDSLDDLTSLKPGDLIFFGDSLKCTHVAIYKGGGFYWHSSGLENGRNGIGCDSLIHFEKDSVASYYKSLFRSVGRIQKCHDGSILP